MELKGKLIYVFGIDGSGKTTLVQNLGKYLKQITPVQVVYSSEMTPFTDELEQVSSRFHTSRRECFSPTLRGAVWGGFG
jgi:thymidylate kinase